MMILAAWCAATAYLLWVQRPQLVWAGWLALVVPALLMKATLPVFFTGMLTALMMWNSRQIAPSGPTVTTRRALARFWQEVQVLVSSGLTFWQAVEIAAGAEPEISDVIRSMAEHIARKPSRRAKNVFWPGEDGDLTLLLMQHGYVHGITEEQIRSEVHHIDSRLTIEEELRKRRDPLWMTTLPAILLVNVLWVFVVPMIQMAHQSWFRL